MCQKAFLSESWSWSSSSSFEKFSRHTHFQRTMTICARRFSSGSLSHGHRLFLSQLRFGDGAVQAAPVFGSGGSSAKKGFLCFSAV